MDVSRFERSLVRMSWKKKRYFSSKFESSMSTFWNEGDILKVEWNIG